MNENDKQAEPVACIGTNGELVWLNKPSVIYNKPIPLYTHPAPAAAINEQMLDVLNETQRDLTILLGNIFASSKRDKNWEGMYDIVNGWITRNHKAIVEAEKAKGGV